MVRNIGFLEDFYSWYFSKMHGIVRLDLHIVWKKCLHLSKFPSTEPGIHFLLHSLFSSFHAQIGHIGHLWK